MQHVCRRADEAGQHPLELELAPAGQHQALAVVGACRRCRGWCLGIATRQPCRGCASTRITPAGLALDAQAAQLRRNVVSPTAAATKSIAFILARGLDADDLVGALPLWRLRRLPCLVQPAQAAAGRGPAGGAASVGPAILVLTAVIQHHRLPAASSGKRVCTIVRVVCRHRRCRAVVVTVLKGVECTSAPTFRCQLHQQGLPLCLGQLWRHFCPQAARGLSRAAWGEAE